MSDDDCVKLGLDPKWARPDWMINVVLPVPPPAVRPAIAIDSVSRGEDDLTHKLADIVKVGCVTSPSVPLNAKKNCLFVCLSAIVEIGE